MGLPLGPTLANVFMSHVENNYFMSPNNNVTFKPSLYLRYIDDIFCVFKSQDHIQHFLNMINSFHNNLQFTIEFSQNNILPFLDVSIKVEDNKCSTSVYRKPTYTNLLMNFSACCPFTYKIGLLNCLIFRAFKICSSWYSFHEEIQYLLNLFVSNAFPSKLFFNTLKRFLDNVFPIILNRKINLKTSLSYLILAPSLTNLKPNLINILNRTTLTLLLSLKVLKSLPIFL